MPRDEALDAMRQVVAQACMQTRDLITPILESAEGVKADMVTRGWSAANAEAVAAAYVQAMLKSSLGGGT
ncbi:hypothetical protein ACFVT5_41375 [Streptomyces sp. NPDC058001]|uniref:hypothetical protein n=1 Tax=Streptomyces sp. NPDC058001 TaxID=3346300 RepID=UPI0036EA925A